MKLLVVLACLLATTWSRSPPVSDFEPVGRQWEYEYEGQVMSGIPSLQEKYSGLGIKCRVEIRKLAPEQFELRMQNLRFAQVNQRFHQGSFSKQLKPLTYLPDPTLEDHLKKPIRFQRIDGHVKTVKVEANDQFWSINIKKAVLSLLNVDLRTVREKTQESPLRQTQSVYQPATTIKEVSVQGICPSTYQVFPRGQGPKSQSELKRDMRASEIQETTEQMIQVTKIVQLDQCDKRPIVIDTTPTIEYCRDCDSHAQDKISESAQTLYVLSPERLVIREAVSEGETIIPRLGQHSAVVSTTQRMRLQRVRNTENVQDLETQYRELPSITYTVPTTLMETMAYFQPMDASSASIDQGAREAGQGITSDPYRQDYLIQHRGQTSQSIKFTPSERQQVIFKIKQNLAELAQDIMHPSQKAQTLETRKPTADVSIKSLASYVSYLTAEELNSVYHTMNTGVALREQDEITRKIFLDCVSMAGTGASVRFLRQLIDEQRLKSYEAVDVLTGLQENVVLPNKDYVDELMNLCHHEQVRKNHFQHSTVCISLGQVLRKACKAPLRVHMTQRPLIPSICRPEHLNRTIDQLAGRLSSATEQEQAVYLQALGHTGTRRALEKVRQYVQRQNLPQILRTSAITALRHIAYHYPQQVLETVLPIYNNRREQEIVRIAASSIIFASKPSYSVLEKMAVDLNHETDNQVGSFVYTTLHTLANSSAPCLQAMAANVSKVVKLARPFRLDRTTAYRKIFALTDLSERVDILVDNEFVTSKQSGLPKYGSARLSTSTPGRLLNQIFEARMFHNGIERAILEKLMESRSDYNQLPVYLRNILEKAKRMPQTGERKEGEAMVRLFERTMFAYISQENVDTYYQKLQSIIRSIEERLRTNYTRTYVKVMLPLKSSVIAPTQIGLPVTFFHTTELVFALRLKDVRMEIQPSQYLTEQTAELIRFKAQGTVTPFLRHESSDVIGVVNPANLKIYSTGHYIRTIVNLPTTLKLDYQRLTRNMTTVLRPHAQEMFFYHVSTPFTAISDIRTMKPLYNANGAQPIITNEQSIKFNKQVGKDTFGIGLRLTGYTQNPWGLQTLAWLKQMKEPTRELPGTIMQLMVNPWLSRRQILVRTERQQQNSQQPTQLLTSMRYTQEKETDVTGQVSMTEKRRLTNKVHFEVVLQSGDRPRHVRGEVFVQEKEQDVMELQARITRSPFHTSETSEKRICIFGNTKKLQDLEEDEESLYSSQLQTPQREPRLRQVRELKIQYGQQCEGGSEVHIKGNLKETIKEIENLSQPRRALADELKRRCKREEQQLMEQRYQALQQDQSPEYVQQSKTCKLARQDKAVIRTAEYEIKRQRVDLDMRPALAYLEYIMFPFRELNHSQSQQEQESRIQPNQVRVTVETLQGLPLTTLTIVDRNRTLRFKDVHHQYNLVNDLLAATTKVQLSQVLPLQYLIPARGICRISGSSIRTFDHVQYPFSQSKCEYVVAQDLTPEQKFVVTVSRKTEFSEAKFVKVLVGSKIIEVQPPSSLYWSSSLPTVKVDGQIIQLSSETPTHYTFLTASRASQLIVKLRYHQSLSNQIVEIDVPSLGLQVETDGKNVIVKVPRSRRGQVGGLCGNNNGEQINEFRGLDECEYESVQEFVQSYQVPSLECPEQPQPSYCRQQQQQQPQEQQQHGQYVELKNKYEPRGSTICFSTRPQPKCRRGYEQIQTQEVEVKYHCIQSEASLAQRFVQLIDNEEMYEQQVNEQGLHMLINKSADYTRLELLPSVCQPAY